MRLCRPAGRRARALKRSVLEIPRDLGFWDLRDIARSRDLGDLARSREISAMSCDPRSHGISGHMRSRLLASKRAPRVVGRPTPRGARVRVDVRVTACACERARPRAYPRACSARVCAHAARRAPRIFRIFSGTSRLLLRRFGVECRRSTARGF